MSVPSRNFLSKTIFRVFNVSVTKKSPIHRFQTSNVSSKPIFGRLMASSNAAPQTPQLQHTTSFHQYTISVEGNIGCGKTTFLNHFLPSPEVRIFDEPVAKWRDVKGHNLLGLMYEDQSRWSLTFQTYVQLTMLENHTCKSPHAIKMMERSIYSAKYCFVENLYKMGKMPAPEYAVLTEWFDWINKNLDTSLNLIVYLRSSPEVVYKRILDRKRPEEHDIPMDYLIKLHDLHEDWLLGQSQFTIPAPVIVIDANQGIDKMLDEYQKSAQQIPHLRQRIVV